ncbi:MAG TPA: hypothetical protein PKA00_18060 [Saprospiraceae bacterium]|nr:hypothetical protein [Saprospiraceae bacterium]HMQ84823.1 hypothetical protein [Saprospiraceae bacterium]
MNLRVTTTIVAALLSWSLPSSLVGQSSIFDQMYGDAIINIEIEANLEEIINERRSEEDLPAIFSLALPNGQRENYEIKLKSRGKFRRRVCEFPPLTLNFPKKRLKEAGLAADFDKLKLVTHCLDDKIMGNDNVLKEYLVYQLYQQLAAESYRVQLARVTYVDSAKQLGKIKRYAFLIEDTDEMATRIGGEECEDCRGALRDSLDSVIAMRTAVFQYMIGNADWDMAMLRNLKIVRTPNKPSWIPVPYDFDFSGLVATSYAVPSRDHGLLSIKERVYLGPASSESQLVETLRHFIRNKPAMYNTIDQFKLLDRASKDNMIAYLDTFFAEADQIVESNTAQLEASTLYQQATKNLGGFQTSYTE